MRDLRLTSVGVQHLVKLKEDMRGRIRLLSAERGLTPFALIRNRYEFDLTLDELIVELATLGVATTEINYKGIQLADIKSEEFSTATAIEGPVQPLPKFEMVDWNELSKRGLLRRINTEILHPLGLAACRNPDTGTSPGALVSPDGEWYYEDAEGVHKLTVPVVTADELLKEKHENVYQGDRTGKAE